MTDSEPITKKDLEGVVAEIKVLVREVQDVLLAHFRNQVKAQAARIDARETDDAAIIERLHMLEERVTNLEMRPSARPN
jgi:hypothetical protein